MSIRITESGDRVFDTKERAMETRLVRLKPRDPRRRHVLRTYTYDGNKFQCDRGWYRVSVEAATHLATVRQVGGDPHSPLAFDVCKEAEARALDRQGKKAKDEPTRANEEVPLMLGRNEAKRAPAESDAESATPPGDAPSTAADKADRRSNKKDRG